MSVETNIATVRAAIAAISAGDLPALSRTVTPDYERHDLGNTLTAGSSVELMDLIASIRRALPDFTFEIEKAIGSEDDHVSIIFRMRGTHQGEFLGAPGSGRLVEIRGMGLYRLIDGRIRDNWQLLDTLGLMSQLGVTAATV